MKWSIKIGKFVGIDVYMHLTFLLLVGWVALVHWQRGQSIGAAMVGVLFILAIFMCVVLHEIGHLQQRYQLQTQAVPRGPMENYFRKTGKFTEKGEEILELTPRGQNMLEMEIRFREVDRSLRIKQEAIERAIANPADRDIWLQKAEDAQQVIDDTRKYFKDKDIGRRPVRHDDVTDPNITLDGETENKIKLKKLLKELENWDKGI